MPYADDMSTAAPLTLSEAEMAEIRKDCQVGLDDIAAGRVEPDSDALFERISADVNRAVILLHIVRKRLMMRS